MAVPFSALSRKPYREQLVWFLNGFWAGEEDPNAFAAKLWSVYQLFLELDPKGTEGNELDEFNSHRVLEKFEEALSVIKMREALRAIDQDANGYMSLMEYAAWKWHKSVNDVENAPQGANQELMAAAEAKMAEVQVAIDDLTPKLEAATAAFNVVKAAEDEVAAAVAELKAQEDAYASKCADLEARSSDTSTGVVTRNKAAAELAQLKAEDPLPLRKAKITQEAALRKAERARQAAEEPKLRLEEAYAALEARMQEAVDELEAAKRAGGVAQGSLYVADRELFIADQSLPRARQRYDHSKPYSYAFEA